MQGVGIRHKTKYTNEINLKSTKNSSVKTKLKNMRSFHESNHVNYSVHHVFTVLTLPNVAVNSPR